MVLFVVTVRGNLSVPERCETYLNVVDVHYGSLWNAKYRQSCFSNSARWLVTDLGKKSKKRPEVYTKYLNIYETVYFMKLYFSVYEILFIDYKNKNIDHKRRGN